MSTARVMCYNTWAVMVSAWREQLLSSTNLFVFDSIFAEQTIFFERKWSVCTEALNGGERGRVAVADDLLICIIYINIYKYIIYIILYIDSRRRFSLYIYSAILPLVRTTHQEIARLLFWSCINMWVFISVAYICSGVCCHFWPSEWWMTARRSIPPPTHDLHDPSS